MFPWSEIWLETNQRDSRKATSEQNQVFVGQTNTKDEIIILPNS